jgi:hypothetical protein
MKVRKGFVSNSSSCSFLLYGTYTDDKDLIEKAEKFNSKLTSKGIETYSMDFSDGLYIGKSPDKMRDDQTMSDFKKEVAQTIDEILGAPQNYSFLEEAWYNG